ncbi:MAG: nucleoside triphosphate pyrophosphohydrolase [Verrucomicrobiota bacterium]
MTPFERLCEIVARLRAPDGCPWDREQTHESLLPGLLEEAYEVVGAARAHDTANLREELGDLLLLVVMQAQIASEGDHFQIDDVIAEVAGKLVRRHPHVFATSNARDTGAVVKQWEAIKRKENKTGGTNYLDTLPVALPALMRAQKAQAKASRVGFDWTDPADVIAKVEEEMRETKEAVASKNSAAIADEIGDLLFAVVNLARKNKLDAELVLQAATNKFVRRFNRLENELKAQDKELGEVDLAEMDAIWNAVKVDASSND